jgi:putative transposase
MPRPLLIRTDVLPYHVTSRCNNKDFFPIPMENVWKIMLRELKKEIKDNNLCIHAFVLMGNHFHLLCHTPKANLDTIMSRFLRSTSIKINTRGEKINHMWGGRYKWSLIDSQHYYFQVYRYIYQNPLRAGLCETVEDYSFSSLRSSNLKIERFFPSQDKTSELLWLNERYRAEDQDVIRLGLRKYKFEIAKRKEGDFNELSFPFKTVKKVDATFR